MKRIYSTLIMTMCFLCHMIAQSTFSSAVVAEEGAWCWFADPRAIHYENADGSINATYIGYIDVHGNVKATQYDWNNKRKTDVLIRSFFQPDDHNNPTFIVLPDERVMIFYTRHTDEPKIWYRISKKPGDITSLGEEKYLATANNTTYPSPYILSDDPTHIYLCWRGINWHPTLARLTMPDANDNCRFDFGPKQIVQSTGSRPYAKYHSNGKDKIYVSYTTGHPDNEMPDWLYFNYIDINKGKGPILRDMKGKQLSVISEGVFRVNKSNEYAQSYPATIVDNTADTRNWVWQTVIDKDGNPVIAYPHIDNAKTDHTYWYARWTGTEWRRTKVANGGHAFHKNWNSTERCYSGGMAIDPENINDLYLSIPTKDGAYDKNGVYEIWKYTINDQGKVSGQKQITTDSKKNNIRPYAIPGSKNSPMRMAWMNGDYYYWMVNQGYKQGYPTGIHCDYTWTETLTEAPNNQNQNESISFGPNTSIHIAFAMNEQDYAGTLLTIGEDKKDGKGISYSIEPQEQRPIITINGKTYKSQNRLLTSDNWAYNSRGTNGDSHPTKMTTWILSITCDNNRLITYRNGFVDQVIELENGEITNNTSDKILGKSTPEGHKILAFMQSDVCQSPMSVQSAVTKLQEKMDAEKAENALNMIFMPTETRTDLVLPTSILGFDVIWKSSNEKAITPNGVLASLSTDTPVTLTASIAGKSRTFDVMALARNIEKNLCYNNSSIDMTNNTGMGFYTNKTTLAPEGLLKGLRSYTFLLTVNIKNMTKQPRLYDFGSGSSNSLFLRADALAAGIKYNGGTTTMVTSPSKLQTGKDYKLAVTYDAATRKTTIYIDGQEDVSGTANQTEAYQLAEISKDNRNYIGRTQWWDGQYSAENQDFCGSIKDFRLYNTCLTQKEISRIQGLPFEQEELQTELLNGDFEGLYSVQAGSGVSNDRAIYIPEGWKVDRANANNNDITALRSGDLYFDRFFGSITQLDNHGNQTYWIRHNWGTPTLTLWQEMLLPEGQYTLNCDLWKNGQGGDATASVRTEGGVTVETKSAKDLTEWQSLSLDFTSDGRATTTISLNATHHTNGSETIIGWDNITIVPKNPNSIIDINKKEVEDNVFYDLSGRKTFTPTRGIYIQNKRKVVIR